MVDWNHNGERDAFDFAMDMMAIEEMERASSSNRRSSARGRSMADVSWSEIGCFAYGMFFIVFPVVMAIFFIFMGEGDLLLLTAGLAVALNYAIYRLFLAPPKDTAKQPKPKTSQPKAKYTVSEPSTEPPKQTVEPPHIERMGHYDVAVEHGSITIKKFLGIDDAVQTVPAIIYDFPVRIIDTGAYLNCKHIEKVIIAEGIVEICNGAFKGCDKLKEVVIPRSANTIGTDAFPHGQDIVLYCYGGSAGLDFARKYKYEYRDAEDMHPSEVKAEPKTEPKQEQQKVSAQNDSKKKTNYSTGSSSSSYSKNTASHTSNYAAGIAASTLLLDDSDNDDTDWLNHETARDRLDFELLGTGYDSYDLEWMDEDERDEIMWDNGLDPFDYDFYDLDE